MVLDELKKVLAYSTISQIGYMMLGLGVAGLSTSSNFAFMLLDVLNVCTLFSKEY